MRKKVLVVWIILILAAFGVHYGLDSAQVCGEGGAVCAYFIDTFSAQLGNSLIVFLLLWWFGAPAVAKMVAERKSKIEREIDENGRVKEAASVRAAEAEKKLSQLSEERTLMSRSYEAAIKAECEQIEADSKAQAERLKRDANASYELQVSSSRRRFEREVVTESVARAREEIAKRLSENSALRDKLIDQSIASFEL